MSKKLSLNIFRLLHNRSRTTSLRRLERQGMRNVTVLDMKDLNNLIQDAVNATLGDFGIALSQEELQQVNDRTREEFLRVLVDRDELRETMRDMGREMDTLRQNFQILKTELEVNNQLLKKEEERTPEETAPAAIPPDQKDALALRLKERLEELYGETGTGEEFKEKAIVIAMQLISEEREKATESAKLQQEDRISTLKRRISKLKTKLQETETFLERVKEKGVQDSGLASEFRSVQGLNGDAAFREEKAMLLKEIFNLNMDLKKLMAER